MSEITQILREISGGNQQSAEQLLSLVYTELKRIAVNAEGVVQWGQPVGDRPAVVKEELTQEYVTGTLLLEGSEVLQMLRAQAEQQDKRISNPFP